MSGVAQTDWRSLYELERAKVIQCTKAMLAVAERLKPHASTEVQALGNLLLWAIELLSEARAAPVSQEPSPRDWVADVLAFHRTFGQPVGVKPEIPSTFEQSGPGLVRFRLSLIDEERHELIDAINADDVVEVADALADLIYVLIGTGIAFGIDLRPVWAEVHRSNMAKVGGGKRADGKTLKPAGWTPPDIATALTLGNLGKGAL